MSRSEVSRLRALLTARGDFWDLRWDIEQLERAWRNEIVTIPPLIAQKSGSAKSATGSRTEHWNFVPEISTVAVPRAKVYLKDPRDLTKEDRLPQANSAKRYRIGIRILSLDQEVSQRNPIKTNLFIVKGNPLVTSPIPLPCFASGTGTVVIDLRDGQEAEGLSVQVLLNDLFAHFALPLDELLDEASSSEAIERTMSIWDTQTGGMRTSCVARISVEREQPLSVGELAELRRREWGLVTSPPAINREEPRSVTTVSEEQVPEAVIVMEQPPVQEENMFSQWSQRANDFLATAREYAGTLEEKKEEKLIALEQQPAQRRRRNKTTNFEINNSNDGIINTVIPE